MYIDPNNNIIKFDSLAEAGEFIGRGWRYRESRMASDGSEWTGNLSFYDCARMAISGDESNVSDAERLIDKFNHHIITSGAEECPSVAGHYPVVPEYLSGAPDCMRDLDSVQTDHSPLSIVYNMTSQNWVTAEQIKLRGTAVLALTMQLARVRPITLDVITTLDGRKRLGSKIDGYWSIITARINTTPLDIASAAFAMTRVGLARNLFYPCANIEHGYTGSFAKFDGKHDCRMPAEQQTEFIRTALDLNNEILYLPVAMAGDLSIANPQEWIDQMIEKYTTGLQA